MKVLKITLIYFLIFLALLGIFYTIGKKYSYSKIAVDLLFKAINSKINGSLIAEKPSLRLKGRFLNAYADNIQLLDETGNVIFVAKKVDIIWSLTNLINPGQHFKKIQAKKVKIQAIRDEQGVWNYENILKQKTKKKLDYKVALLNLPVLTLNIEDKLIDSNISFHKMSLFYQDHSRKKIFRLRSDQSIVKNENGGMSSKDIADLSNTDLSNLIDIDSIVIPGNLVRSSEEKYKIRVINLDPINIRFILSLIDFGNHPNLKDILNKYSETVKLTVIADVNPEAKDNNAKLKIILNNLVDINELKLVSTLDLREDLNIKDLNLSFDSTNISLNGEIKKWKSTNPPINLESKITNLNIRKLRTSFEEIERLVPDFFLEMLASLHANNFIQGDIKLTGKQKTPNLILALPVDSSLGKNQSITVNAQYLEDRIVINKATIPMDISDLNISGFYLLDESNYDLKFKADDLPILKLRNLFVHLPALHNYQAYLISPILSGYTTFDLNIKPKYIKGDIKVAKVAYFTEEIPVTFEDLNADLDIENSRLIINSISSVIDGNYLEARTKIDMNIDPSKLKYEAEIASPELDASIIDRSRLLELNEQTKSISRLSGTIKDFYVNVKKTNLIDLAGRVELDGLAFRYKEDYAFKNIHGTFVANKQGYKFENISLSLNNSPVKMNGSSDKEIKKPKIKLSAVNLGFAEFMNLINSQEKYKLFANKGSLSADLELNGAALYGEGSLKNADFILKSSSKLKYPFLNMTGDFKVSKDLKLNNLSGSYGSSSFKNSALDLMSYQSQDKTFDLNFNGNLVIAELEGLIPESISKFLSTRGALPAKIIASGNSKKSFYDVTAETNKMELFSFANWLEIDKRYKVVAKTKFVVTPQLIFSEMAKITSSRNESVTELDASFQVQDWKEKDNATVSFKTSTLNGGTLKANMGLLTPHIISLKPLNLEAGMGSMNCDTSSDDATRQTICQFFVDNAIARKYGIGDLTATDIRVDLVSVTDKPLDAQVRLRDGDWHGIDYKKIKFDLRIYDEFLEMNNLKAGLPDFGNVRGTTKFNFKTLESEFFLRGNRISANKLVEGVWGFGVEVPEGYVSGIFKGKTKGLLPDEMFFNMVADSQVIVRDGKLSSLKTMQKILSAINTLKNFDFNNVFQTLITYKGGIFNYAISTLNYDHGRVSSEKVLLKAEEIELNLNGFIDYAKDQLAIGGQGLIPKRSKSILQTVGVGGANLGNLLSIANLGSGGNNSKNFFEFKMIGPVTDMDKTVESVKSSFKWIEL